MTNTSSWSYAENGFGPQSWHERYKVAKGNLQSPINIETAQAEEGNNVGPIQFQYENIHNSTVTNDGRHLQVTFTRNESAVTGGPLTDRYQLAVIRFHWGNDNDSGSEHSVDGQKYPLEVQLIHWNSDLYKNIGEAITGENGLCIIGLLYQVSDEDNSGLAPVVKLLSRDEHKGCFSLEVKSAIDPNEFIGDMTAYWTYQGSLTTPPLSENVTWVISKNIMGLSEEQMNVFRNVRNSSGEAMTDHCRPPCPLNERPVRSCTCVVKNTSIESHTEISNNHYVDDDADALNGNKGIDESEDDIKEKAVYEENRNHHGSDAEDNCAVDGNNDIDGIEDCEEKVVYEENENHRESDAYEDTENALYVQEANCHDNDKSHDKCDDADDDTEEALYDENENRHINDDKCGTITLDDGLLELVNSLAE